MTTNKSILAGTGVALIALVSLALSFSLAHAADLSEDDGWMDTGYQTYSEPTYNNNDSGWMDTGWQSISEPTYNDSGWMDTGWQTMTNPTDWSSGCTFDCSGSSGGSGSMFGGSSGCSSCGGGGGYSNPIFSQPPVYSTPSNVAIRNDIATCTAVNSCNTDSSYHYTDNSVYSAPTTVTIAQDSHNQQISYAPQSEKKQRNDYYQPVYTQPQPTCNNSYGYNGYGNGYNQGYNNCYTAPVAYNTTPYVTLSAMPYTGLDLGPMGEVLYWTFLVLWCLGAAYLIVVKRVQNKLVSFLNGFLFGTTSGATVAHATSAPARAHAVAASAPVEEGIDSFIASQIKRS